MRGMREVAGLLGTALVLAGAAAGCGSGDDGPATTGAAAATPTSPTTSGSSALAKVCPRKIAIQTDWYPEPEHGGLYALAGPNGEVDTKKGTYTGEIQGTGIQLEIRAGGPYAGNQQVSSLLYQDPSLFAGFVNTDEAVALSGKLPTVGVFTLLNLSPSALMWDPSKYDIKTLGDIAKTDAKVVYFEGTAFVDYLVGKGMLRKDQLDASYDGSPSRFVASRGSIVQEAFATSEPYKYENDLKAWNKPIAFKLVSESGYAPYPETIAVRKGTLAAKSACLKELVPLMQRASAEFARNPGPTNAAILREVEALKSSWTLSPGGVADSVAKMKQLGIIAEGADGTLGSMDPTRTRRMIDLLRPIYAKQRIKTVKSGLKPADIMTNRFLDPKIGL